MRSREIFTKKCRQQPIFDSDLKEAWHYNHVTFTPIAKSFMLYCRLIYMLSILCVRLTIKVKVGIPESFKVEWYPPKKTGSSHLNSSPLLQQDHLSMEFSNLTYNLRVTVFSCYFMIYLCILSRSIGQKKYNIVAPPPHKRFDNRFR